MKKKISLGTAIALMLLGMVTTFNITFLTSQESFNRRIRNFGTLETEYSKFAEVRNYVDKYFIGDYKYEEAMDLAISGYVLGMGDQWSYYLNKEQYEQYQLENLGSLIGIGVGVSYEVETGDILITSIYENSPAQKAGIKPFDRIIKVEGNLISEIGYTEAVRRVRGQKGTTVNITIKSGNEIKDLAIVRDKFKIVSVKSEMLDGNVGYIKINEFSTDSDKEFKTNLNKLIKDGATSLIFDVRNNPGGDVTAVSAMLDLLVPEGNIISLRSKVGEEMTIKSDAGEINLPMAVLVNQNSISAAEFFAATLMEYKKATIVGEKTNGKGYSQQAIPLKDGSALIISTKTYYTSLGNSLAEAGVTPDVSVSLSEEKQKTLSYLPKADDEQLQKALEILK